MPIPSGVLFWNPKKTVRAWTNTQYRFGETCISSMTSAGMKSIYIARIDSVFFFLWQKGNINLMLPFCVFKLSNRKASGKSATSAHPQGAQQQHWHQSTSFVWRCKLQMRWSRLMMPVNSVAYMIKHFSVPHHPITVGANGIDSSFILTHVDFLCCI